jgi:hypothetical protein
MKAGTICEVNTASSMFEAEEYVLLEPLPGNV